MPRLLDRGIFHLDDKTQTVRSRTVLPWPATAVTVVASILLKSLLIALQKPLAISVLVLSSVAVRRTVSSARIFVEVRTVWVVALAAAGSLNRCKSHPDSLAVALSDRCYCNRSSHNHPGRTGHSDLARNDHSLDANRDHDRDPSLDPVGHDSGTDGHDSSPYLAGSVSKHFVPERRRLKTLPR